MCSTPALGWDLGPRGMTVALVQGGQEWDCGARNRGSRKKPH